MSRVKYKRANSVHRFMRDLAATAPVSWFFARLLHHVDVSMFRLTKGRRDLAGSVSGLPVVMLTTRGARSKRVRAVPLLGIPDGERIVVIASNYGQRNHPAWYYNLLAHPEAEVSVGGKTHRVRAYEAEDEERERLWRLGLEVYPGWAGYERRAANRRIPVMVLSPED